MPTLPSDIFPAEYGPEDVRNHMPNATLYESGLGDDFVCPGCGMQTPGFVSPDSRHGGVRWFCTAKGNRCFYNYRAFGLEVTTMDEYTNLYNGGDFTGTFDPTLAQAFQQVFQQEFDSNPYKNQRFNNF